MRVKTYRGASTNQVLARIKDELGADAVILGTRNYEEDGATVAEVTAALEDPAPKKSAGACRASGNGSSPGSGSNGSGVPPAPESWGQWHKEWSRIKEHLSALLRPQLDFSQLAPIQRQALEYLEREGVDCDVVLDIFTTLKGSPKCSVLVPLEKNVAVKPWSHRQWPERYHAVAGPSGVGKTMALLRMALERKRESDGARICLVNADARRMKSKVVLKHYAELAGLDYYEIKEPIDAAKLVAESDNWDLVLVDLPAVERGSTLDEMLQELGLDAVEGLRVHLTLSPHFAPAQFSGILSQYRSDKAASLVWTKLDETYSYGTMVNTAWATGLPCSALSFGAAISGSMMPARHLELWRMLFKHQLPQEEQKAA